MRNASFWDILHEPKQVVNKLSRVRSTDWKSALTSLFWWRVIGHEVFTTRRFVPQNPELFVTRVFLVFFRQQPETTLEQCSFDFRIPRRHDVDGKVLLRSLHVLMLCVCSTTMVSFLCLGFTCNSTATGHFRRKNSNHSAHRKTFFSLQTWKVVEMTFFNYNSFCFWVNKNIRLHNHAKRTLCKDADFT